MSEKQRVTEYLEKFEQLESIRGPWEDVWEDVTTYVMPGRDMWEDEDTRQSSKAEGKEIFDERAVSAHQILTNGLVGYNVGPSIRWCKLKAIPDEVNEIPGVADWLERCEAILYLIFHRSNLYEAVNEYYADLTGIGTASMIVEEGREPLSLNYSTRHPKETYIAEGDKKVDSVMRKVWMTGRQALLRYGDELPENLRKDMEEAPYEKHAFLHVVHPRDDRVVYDLGNMQMPYASVEMLFDGDTILKESGYLENPVLVSRWRKDSQEWYGRCPAIDAMPAIKRANVIQKAMLDTAQLHARPPLNVPQARARDLNLTPFGINRYRDPNEVIKPINIGGNFPLTIDSLDRIHQAIEDHFYSDMFLMLQRATQAMTAREIVERQGEKVAILSGPLSRGNHEFLAPLVRRTFSIAARAGWLPYPPPILAEMGMDIDVEFTGILAQAQQRYHQSSTVESGLAIIGGLSQMDPQVLDNFNFDDLARVVANSEGFPQTSIREQPEIQQIRAARQREQQRQQQIAEAAASAEILEKTSKKPEEGSSADRVTQQLANSVPRGRLG